MHKKSHILGYVTHSSLPEECWLEFEERWFNMITKDCRSLFLFKNRCVLCRDGKNLNKRGVKDFLLHLTNAHFARIKISIIKPKDPVSDQSCLRLKCDNLRRELEQWLIDHSVNINGESLRPFEYLLTKEMINFKTVTRITRNLGDQIREKGFCVLKFPSDLTEQTLLGKEDLKNFMIPVVSHLDVGGSFRNLGIFYVKEERKQLDPQLTIKDFFKENKLDKNIALKNDDDLFHFLSKIEKRHKLKYGIGLEGHLQRTPVFNLADLGDDEDNILSRAKKNLGSSLNLPSLLIGTQGSIFPLHTEDEDLLSVNIHLYGDVKIWRIIPPKYYEQVIDQIQSKINHEYPNCNNPLRHKNIFVRTDWLENRQIPFETVHQEPGEMIILLARTFHQGFNVGNNVAEAVNFADAGWKTSSKKIHVIAHAKDLNRPFFRKSGLKEFESFVGRLFNCIILYFYFRIQFSLLLIFIPCIKF